MQKNTLLFTVALLLLAGAGVTSAAEMAGDSMMKKDTMMDGKAMMSDEVKMMKAAAPTGNAGMGSRGESVTMLQKYLIEKGFLVLPSSAPMGYFGSATKRAVMAYQQSIGVTPTGYFGPKTRAMMSEKMKMMGGETMMDSKKMEEKKMMEKGAMMKKAGTYGTYSADKLAWAKDGKVVLFFHASWCPTCKFADTAITNGATTIPTNVHILKTDYDTNTALKQKYGVTYQHTFVQVDASGNQIAKWSGSNSIAEIVANTK
ncbi:MAG: peptidoglycan-binding protein [Minisyncoccia bacterium]